VELTGDEVDTCVPGDIVTVAGIVKLISIDAGKPMNRVSKQNKKPIFYNYIDANCVENSKHLVSSASSSSGGDGNTNGSEDKSHISGNSKLESLQFSVKDLYGIQRIAQHPHCMALVCQSMCPTIYGHDLVKAGLALSLFGGKQNRMVDPKGRVSIRGDIHVLIVGDPGLGKSQLLQSVAHISPRGVYVCGSYASASGLTVAIHREAGSQDYILEAGALVLSDQGTCCIDEFDKMPKDWQALLEAMEQQQISIAKAGIVCNLPARSSLIAAANPVHGHYNKGKTVAENLKMNAPLLSRFDLIFILLDRPDQQRDKLISDHVMKLHDRDNYGSSGDPFTNSQHVIHDLEYGQTPAGLSLQDRLRALPPDSDPIPPSLLRKYISYAKRYAEPALTPEASQAIQEFYLQLRHNNANQDGGTPVTTRQLESLIRLAEARAKIELRTSVTRQDAEDVIELFKACLRDTEDSGDLPTLDLRGERPVNKSKARMAFIAALTTVAKQEDKSQFTYQEMYNVSKQINLRLPPPMQFSDLVESLNVDGFILKKKGGAEYKLTTTGP
jgi:DNA helicase MCM8